MQGIEIKPDAWYTEQELRRWGFDTDELSRGRSAGELRYLDRGRSSMRLYKGEWLLKWLEGKAVPA
jgi:hypothetical protein